MAATTPSTGPSRPVGPTAFRTHALVEIAEQGAALLDQEVLIAGHAEDIRGRGGVCFVTLRDGSGHLQAFLKKDLLPEEQFLAVQLASRETTIQIRGTVAQKRPLKVPEGELEPPPEYEVVATAASIIAPAAVPLPVGVTDKVGVDLDTRLDHRVLDLRRAHVNAIFRLRGLVLQSARDSLTSQGFSEINTPKIVATATEGGTDLFPLQYFDRPAFLNQSPQLFKQLCVSGGLERVFEIGPAFRAEKHDTYRHVNEFTSFDIEMGWADDGDVMDVLQQMVHDIHAGVLAHGCEQIATINAWRAEQDPPLDPVDIQVPVLPFLRITYDEAIDIIQSSGGRIEWGEDIDAENSDHLAARHPGYYFVTHWPFALKPFYIHHRTEEKSPSTGGQLSRGFDMNFGRDEMTSGGQREHRINVLTQNLIDMDLDPAGFEYYLEGFRYGVPPHGGWGLGVARILMAMLGVGNVRETVIFPRDRRRVVP